MKKPVLALALSAAMTLSSAGTSHATVAVAPTSSGGGDDAVAIVVILGILGMAIWGGSGSRARTKERVTTTPKGPSNGTWKF